MDGPLHLISGQTSQEGVKYAKAKDEMRFYIYCPYMYTVVTDLYNITVDVPRELFWTRRQAKERIAFYKVHFLQ